VSGALLALAMALLVVPAGSRRRLDGLGLLTSARRRPPVLPALGAFAAVTALAMPVSVVAACAVTGATLWTRRRRRVAANCRAAESLALQGALDVLVGELRVGAHPVAALDVAAREVDGRVAHALRSVAARARLGADVVAGLHGVSATSSMPAHWERLAVCWQLAQEQGLSIAALMHTAQRDIVERERFSARAESGMTGARTTASVLAGLPLLAVVLGELIGAKPLRFLLSGGAGGWLLLAGAMLACGGLLWSDRITAKALT